MIKDVCLAVLMTTALALISSGTRASPGKLRFWAVANSLDDINLYRGLAEDFRKKTGVAVDITPLGWGDFAQKYMTAIAAGTAPDVGIAGATAPPEWGAVGGLVDLEAEFPTEVAAIKDNLLPGTLDQFRFRESLYALPTDLVTMLVYYRPDIFRKLGLKPPQYWSDLHRVITKLERHNYRFYFGWTKGEQWALSYIYTPFGLRGAREIEGRPVLDWLDPKYPSAIGQAIKLWYTHGELGTLPTDREVARFMSEVPDESTPLVIDGTWLAPPIHDLAKRLGKEWAAVPWPIADGGHPSNLMGGTAYVIFKSSRQKKDAMQWISFLLQDESQKKMLLERLSRPNEKATLALSPTLSMWSDQAEEYYALPAFKPYQSVIKSLHKVVYTFKSERKPIGIKEADRLEDQIIDHLRTATLQKLAQNAEAHGLSVWDYVKQRAKGKFKREGQKLESMIHEMAKTEYAKNYPTAIARIEQQMKAFENRSAQSAAQADPILSQFDILSILESLVSLFVGLMLLKIGLTKSLRRHWHAYAMISIPVLITMIFIIIPMLTSLYLAFTEYHAATPLSSARWVGLENFVSATSLEDSDHIFSSLKRTLIYVTLSLPIGVALALLFSFLLNHDLIGKKIWRFLYFSPLVTSSVAVALIFTQIYNESQIGWLNAVLLKAGLISSPLLLIRDQATFLYCVIGLSIWHGLAFNTLVFLAGLQQIPRVLYLAADVDGASFWRKFWHISLPGLRPQILFVVTMGVISGFQVFEPIYMLGGGSGYAGAKFGPNNAGKTLVPLIYDLGFERFKMGQASAVAYILFALLFALTIAQLKLLRCAKQHNL